MPITNAAAAQRFRLWIATYADWQPASWHDSPPRATALEPVADALYSADEAALFVEGFNSCMLGSGQPIWAVAVPITVRYDGDASPGMPVEGHRFPSPQSGESVAAGR